MRQQFLVLLFLDDIPKDRRVYQKCIKNVSTVYQQSIKSVSRIIKKIIKKCVKNSKNVLKRRFHSSAFCSNGRNFSTFVNSIGKKHYKEVNSKNTLFAALFFENTLLLYRWPSLFAGVTFLETPANIKTVDNKGALFSPKSLVF